MHTNTNASTTTAPASAGNRPSDALIWTDGSLGYHGAGGWAFILRHNGKIEERAGHAQGTTSQRMELTAIIMAMHYCLDQNVPQPTIYSDSEYSVKTFNLWARRWGPKDWPKKKNTDLVREGLGLVGRLGPKLQWVRGHSGIQGNERADQLARMAAVDQHPEATRFAQEVRERSIDEKADDLAPARAAFGDLTREEMRWTRAHLLRLAIRLQQDCRPAGVRAAAVIEATTQFWRGVRDEMLAAARSGGGMEAQYLRRKALIAASYL